MMKKFSFVAVLLASAAIFYGCASATDKSTQPDKAVDVDSLTMIGSPQLRANGRPRGFYVLMAASTQRSERKVCEKVLAALNEPRVWRADVESQHAVLGLTDVLLSTRYSVDWSDLEWESLGRVNPGLPTSRAVVDFDNDGDRETIYRTTADFGSKPAQSLSAVSGLPDPGEKFLSNDKDYSIQMSKDPSDRSVILLAELYVDYSAIYPDAHDLLNIGSLDGGQFVDVIRLDHATYSLKGGSVDAGIQWHPVPVRLFKSSAYTGYRVHRLLCEFQTKLPVNGPSL